MLVETVGDNGGLFLVGGLVFLLAALVLFGLRKTGFAQLSGAGVALTLLAYMMAPAPAAFRVIILEETDTDIQITDQAGFHGGYYETNTGDRIALLVDSHWGTARQMKARRPTVIVNLGNRLVFLNAYMYTATGVGAAPVATPIFPGERLATPVPVHLVAPEGYHPPDHLSSETGSETLVVATYTNTPYDPALHGSRAALAAAGEKEAYAF